MGGIEAHRVDYCCYGTTYQKPTCLLTNVRGMAHLACTCSCGGKHEERLTGCKTRQAAAYPAELVNAVTCVLAWSGLGGEAVPGKCPAWLSKLLAKDSIQGRPKVNFAARRSDEGKPAASGVGLSACQSAAPPLKSRSGDDGLKSEQGKPAASGVGLGACQSAALPWSRSEAVRVGTYT